MSDALKTRLGSSDPIKSRLDHRREELASRVEPLEAEAAGEGEWSDGASLALHAAWDEMRRSIICSYACRVEGATRRLAKASTAGLV